MNFFPKIKARPIRHGLRMGRNWPSGAAPTCSGLESSSSILPLTKSLPFPDRRSFLVPAGRPMVSIWRRSARTPQNSLLFDFKTQKWSDWINEPGIVGYPNWSQDGRYVYYDTTNTDHPTFRRVKVGQTHSELLVDLKGLLRYSNAPAFGWSNISLDGSALFVRNLSTDEIYALRLDLP